MSDNKIQLKPTRKTQVGIFLPRTSPKEGIAQPGRFNFGEDQMIESPIEEKIYKALKYLVNESIVIKPQEQIGAYRVDFLLTYKDKNLIVECDSQQFHDRTERERRYEKERDRFLTNEGYAFYHFTGAEICYHLNNVIKEILDYLMDTPIFIPQDISTIIGNQLTDYDISPAEKLLIKILAIYPESRVFIKENLNFDCIGNKEIKSALESLIECGTSILPIDSGIESIPDYLDILKDCIVRINKKALSNKRELLHCQIKEAMEKKDETRLQILIAEFHNLIKG